MNADSSDLRARVAELAARHPELPAFFASASNTVPGSPEGRRIEMILNAFEHAGELGGGDLAPAWGALTSRLERVTGGSIDDAGVAFLDDAIRIKALAMIALNQVRDYTDMSELITKATLRHTAKILSTFDADALSPVGLPLGTILVRRLGLVRPRKRASVSDGQVAVTGDPSAEEWSDATSACTALAALLITGGPAPADDTAQWGPEEVATAIDREGLESWRALLSAIGDDPWSPPAQQLNKAVPAATDKGAAAALREALLLVRKRIELEEHQDVAGRVSEYVAATGITQRAFAARIGTSPSRLSTYASGSVTPSAAMMLRIAKVSARLSAERD